ncbi:homoserine kinase [Salinicoccus sp. ID82-1]|uniref:homoserine kinase n=1 Tax=Salinicoccus sp. ID82-1 TaxID=2820269 RepID=UPI001F01670A|nr:homoserine kinase [Salinicoccus sp. ID82-1]
MMPVHQFKVPATSANLGPGFDSMGLALGKFLHIEAAESSRWEVVFENEFLEVLPRDEKNLVIRTAIWTAEKYGKKMPELKIMMGSEIPLTHGLGSSASAIIAGIELADRFCDLALSDFDKVLCGSELEGHPDNVGPAITGGLFVGYYGSGKLYYHTLDFSGLSAIISVPPYEIDTNEARAALPGTYRKADAVDQNAINNVMLLSIVNKDYPSMGELMMRDLFHEPYRRPLIREYDEVRQIALEEGAYATVISGAGPSLLTLCDMADAGKILNALGKAPGCVHEKVDIYSRE